MDDFCKKIYVIVYEYPWLIKDLKDEDTRKFTGKWYRKKNPKTLSFDWIYIHWDQIERLTAFFDKHT
jgi:hypothetical protein